MALGLIRRSWIVFLSAVVAGAAAWYALRDETPIYERTVSYIAQPSGELPQNRVPDAIRALGGDGGHVTTLSKVLGSQRFLNDAAVAAVGNVLPDYTLVSSVSPGSAVIDVQFRGPRRDVLTALAEAFTPIATRWVRDAYSAYELEFLETSASAGPVHPKTRQTVTLAALLGALLGGGLIFGEFKLRERRARATGLRALEHELQVPLLGKFPTPGRRDAATILDRAPDATTDAVARLRTSFEFTNKELSAEIVMVTSARSGEGKSTIVTNLAISLAKAGRHVVLVDLDLRRPTIARLLYLPDGPGITDLASGNAELFQVLQPVQVTLPSVRVTPIVAAETGHGSLDVVGAGKTLVDPSAFVESAGLSDVLHKLRAHADIVLVDVPPLLVTGDAIALTDKVDAIVLVSRLGTLTRPTLQELARILRRSPAPVLGFVATGAEIDESYNAYAVDEHYAQNHSQAEHGEPRSRLEVPEVRRASTPSRWSPRRRG